jgi:Phospholipase_D-nuclease N-terminal
VARRRRKRWSDLSGRQRAAVGAAGLVQVALFAVAQMDLRRRRPDQLRGSKALWTAVSFVNFVGPLAYFALGRRR